MTRFGKTGAGILIHYSRTKFCTYLKEEAGFASNCIVATHFDLLDNAENL